MYNAATDSYLCPYCSFRLETFISLKAHVLAEHAAEPLPTLPEPGCSTHHTYHRSSVPGLSFVPPLLSFHFPYLEDDIIDVFMLLLDRAQDPLFPHPHLEQPRAAVHIHEHTAVLGTDNHCLVSVPSHDLLPPFFETDLVLNVAAGNILKNAGKNIFD